MHSTTISYSILIFFIVGFCESSLLDGPNWLGTFNVDDSCNTNECCCLSEIATITKASDTQLLVTANVQGVACQQQLNGSTSVSILIPIPTDKSGFQLTMNFLGSNNRFTLSSDSQYIANVNLDFPRCSGSANRVNSNWFGTYAVDDSCLQTECCCLVGQAKISQMSDTQYVVSTNVTGATCGAPINQTVPVQIPIPIPKDKNGFQLTTLFVGSTNRFTLTYDNQFIVNANLQQPKCSGMAKRIPNSYEKSAVSSSLLK